MSKVELKPCCKCGCEAELISQTTVWRTVHHYVQCTNPDCNERTLICASKIDAINAWNRRAGNDSNT